MDGYDSNNHYTESVTYDANSNIETLQRYGMLNDKLYGLIDDLSVEYNGNQRVSVEDESDAKLTYAGAFDFVDGVTRSKEYTYNGNGALTKDLNKGITKIEYDLLGNPTKVTMKDGNNIEYVYAADGTRLKATHNTKLSAGRYSSRDRYYRGNLIFVRSNDKLPYTVLVPGGYYFYESADEAFYLSLYVQDYQGNNRAELYEGNSVFEQTHYYPFGGVIGDLSSTSSYNAGNEFKFSGKELDRNFGLDLYDFHARQYDPLIPGFNGQDKHAEKYYWLSPYNYCAGNPVNCVDPDGKDMGVLFAPAGAHRAGHIAILIEHKDGRYYLYSKNGTEENHGLYGANKRDDNGGKWTSVEGISYGSVQEFMNSDFNNNVLEHPYEQAYQLDTDDAAEQAAVDAALGQLEENYNVLGGEGKEGAGANCAELVQSALKATQNENVKTNTPLKSGETTTPLKGKAIGAIIGALSPIRGGAKLGADIGGLAQDKTPKFIFERIVEQNPGGQFYNRNK